MGWILIQHRFIPICRKSTNEFFNRWMIRYEQTTSNFKIEELINEMGTADHLKWRALGYVSACYHLGAIEFQEYNDFCNRIIDV